MDDKKRGWFALYEFIYGNREGAGCLGFVWSSFLAVVVILVPAILGPSEVLGPIGAILYTFLYLLVGYLAFFDDAFNHRGIHDRVSWVQRLGDEGRWGHLFWILTIAGCVITISRY